MTSWHIKNRLSLHFGILLRSRLLHGILQLRPEEIQHQGSGHFIGNVQEIEHLEAMGMSTAFLAFVALLEVLIAVVVLMLGAGGWLHGALLLGWSGGILILSRVYYQRMRAWLIHSRMMTCDLVERMVGHRTRLAQEKPDQLHDLEDRLLSRYAHLSEKLDSIEVIMKSATGRRGWLPMSLLGTLTLFFSTKANITLLAVSLGGTLLAALALDQLMQSIYQFLKAMMSWQQVQPLYQAASREQEQKPPHFVAPSYFQNQGAEQPIIQAKNLCFSYPAASEREKRIILDHCDLTIQPGQHLLLEGTSGCGKSTLAALLSALEQPDAGSLYLFGLPLATLGGDAWRKR
ncbi:MAG: ABC transporter ATP-binding protein, partial [Candidatus Electrothrix sp. AR3]|nr:ABC transporter ATP-binding protein [Candidatus Electrothrix sp. AR3]